MLPIIVADIGGTNARFGLATEADTSISITQQHTFKCAEHHSFQDVFSSYLSHISTDNVKKVCIAIAGPITGDIVKMTNLDWEFSINEIKQTYSLERFEVINDFAAQALSVTQLTQQDLLQIKDGIEVQNAPKVIIGPGTGLGVGSLVNTNNKWIALAGEGGHANFAPSNTLEIEMYKILHDREHYLSIENLLSGNGLVNIFNALCEIHGEIIENPKTINPASITEKALTNEHTIEYKAVITFCNILGCAAGNVALTLGARGGVFLAGGILPRVPQILQASNFIERFNNKGMMRDYASAIPVNLITHTQPALLGAYAFMKD